MSATSPYRLPDEPAPGALERYAVDPMWPLLAVMLAGSGAGLVWFVLNGLALGSPTRTKEWLMAGASVMGSAALLVLIHHMRAIGLLGEAQLPYAMLSITVLKLAAAYGIYVMQARCYELWQHYGGSGRNGAPVLMLLAILGPGLMGVERWPPLLKAALG